MTGVEAEAGTGDTGDTVIGQGAEKDIDTDEGKMIELSEEYAVGVVKGETADTGVEAPIDSGQGRMSGSQEEIMTEGRAEVDIQMEGIEKET